MVVLTYCLLCRPSLACVAGVQRGGKGKRRACEAREAREVRETCSIILILSLPFYGLPCRLPVPAVTSVGLCSTSDVITFAQNWDNLFSSSVEGKDLSDDTQIKVIVSMEPEICTKRLRNMSEEFTANQCPATTGGYSMVKLKLPVSMRLFQNFLNWKQAQ